METAVKCPNCNADRIANVDPCPNCGAPGFQQAAPSPPVGPPAPYTMSGKTGNALGLAAIALAASIVVGIVYHYIAQFRDYPIISPLLAGALVGLLTMSAAKVTRTRNLALIMALGFVGGLLCYSVRLVADSQTERPLLVKIGAKALEHMDNMNPQAALTKANQRLNPWRTLTYFLEIESVAGVTIVDENSPSTTSSNSPLTGTSFWLLTIAELAVCGIGALLVANSFKNYSAPYCENDQIWMKATPIAKLPLQQSQNLINAIQTRNWQSILMARSMQTSNSRSFVTATLYRCPTCGNSTISVFRQNGNNLNRPLHVWVEPDVAAYLQANMPMGPKR